MKHRNPVGERGNGHVGILHLGRSGGEQERAPDYDIFNIQGADLTPRCLRYEADATSRITSTTTLPLAGDSCVLVESGVIQPVIRSNNGIAISHPAPPSSLLRLPLPVLEWPGALIAVHQSLLQGVVIDVIKLMNVRCCARGDRASELSRVQTDAEVLCEWMRTRARDWRASAIG
eukprot:759825-Hanusia_phi.AAC.5